MVCLGRLLRIALLGWLEIEEQKAIPFGSRQFAGDGAERSVDPLLELKSVRQYAHDDLSPLVLAPEDGAGGG